MLQVYGVPFSAHTRKVLFALREKDLPFELVPINPLRAPADFRGLSPLGKIPVLRSSELTVPDSSVILQYLERIQPTPALYPSAPAELARALWIEEYVDSGLAPHVLGGLLIERVAAPLFLNRAPNEALIRRSVDHEIPARLSYLDQNLTGELFVGERLSVADIAVSSMLINFQLAGERLDAYPKLQHYLQKLFLRPAFARTLAEELPVAERIEGFDLSVLRQAS